MSAAIAGRGKRQPAGSPCGYSGQDRRSGWQVKVALGAGRCSACINRCGVSADGRGSNQNVDVGDGEKKKCSLTDSEAVMRDWSKIRSLNMILGYDL